EGKANNLYYALTRPMGECYFASPHQSAYHPGAAIHLALSPDLLYWKPSNEPFLRARKSSAANLKVGGGTPPLRSRDGWLMLYHGVENNGEIGCYRTFWAILDGDDPQTILRLEDQEPLLEASPELTAPISHQMYLHDVVFSTGIVAHKDQYIIASGESDLACRITVIEKNFFYGGA
ncbi:MAG TPA: hypothetical protein VKU83_07185, partial [Puia sp.]|nr:hypothetical protein [Puia sp.]